MRVHVLSRRVLSWFVLCLALVLVALVPRSSRAFGEEGAFNPRILLTGTARWEGARTTGPGRWSEELVRRTSAPARLIPTTVRAMTIAGAVVMAVGCAGAVLFAVLFGHLGDLPLLVPGAVAVAGVIFLITAQGMAVVSDAGLSAAESRTARTGS